MVYSQLFVSDEEQQNALRRAQQEQAFQQRGSFNGASAGNMNSNLMQQLQQAQANLNQQIREVAGGSSNSALMQAQLQQQLGGFGGNLGGGLVSNFGQLGGGNLGGGGFGNSLGGGYGNLGNLGASLGANLGANLGQLGGGNGLGGGPSLLEMQRAENLLAAMSNNGMQGMGQLSSMMNSNQAALLQSRLNNNLFGPNTQLPLSQESILNKNQMLSNLASNHGFPGSFNPLGQFEQEMTLGKRRRSLDDGMSPMRKQLAGGRLPHDFKLSDDLLGMDDIQSRKPEPKSRRKAKSFPVKLMTSLVENSNEQAVAWLPDGKSFVIVNPDLFVDTILKKTFKECKYASFVRKLHRWGFVRLTSGTGTDCFHHPLFQRNRADLCARIVCTPRDPLKASETEKRVAAATSMTNDKPPSLAGVEKFFRSRPVGSVNPSEQSDLRKNIDDHDHDDDVDDDVRLDVITPGDVVPTAEAAV